MARLLMDPLFPHICPGTPERPYLCSICLWLARHYFLRRDENSSESACNV